MRLCPAAGLALGAVHEFSEEGPRGHYAACASLFAAGILARLQGPVLWCLHSRDLFAPALARVGLHPDRIIFCETWKDAEILPAMEEGLRMRGLAGVVGELNRMSLTPSRRLQLAAETSGVPASRHPAVRRASSRKQCRDDRAGAFRPRRPMETSPYRMGRPLLARRTFAMQGRIAEYLDYGGMQCGGSLRSSCRRSRPIRCGGGTAALQRVSGRW